VSAVPAIRELLGQIGSTSAQIAETLAGRNITGLREDPHCCPIANLITADVPGADWWKQEEFMVDGLDVVTPDGEIEVPDAVRLFIRDFDDGLYPELEDEPRAEQ
jgi:hypothetical protein